MKEVVKNSGILLLGRMLGSNPWLTRKAPVQQTELHFRPFSLIDSSSLAIVSSSSPRLEGQLKSLIVQVEVV